MKKVYLSAIAFLLILINSQTSQAQQESSFGAFLASPVGDFKSSDLQVGGFAKQGWGIVFDSKMKIKSIPEEWSLNFHSTYQWNAMDADAMEKEFSEYLGLKTEVSESKYSPLLTTIGPCYEFSFGEKIKLGLTTTIGVMFNNTKAFTIKVYDDNGNQTANELINFDGNVAFAYSFGTEFKYELMPDLLGISLYVDYTSAKQKIEIYSQNIEPGDSFQKLQYFNSGLKLVFYTTKK